MPELPTGTVTFLFTDLEGSTRLWEEHADGMRGPLARHDEILRAAVDKRDGQVVKTTGDGMHAVFAVASDAITAAIDAQRALVNEEWTLPEPLKVRMGLHSGAAELRDGDYFGSAVNRAARIAAAAHGGQIVASAPTADLARDDLPVEVSFVELGEHRLRDLGRPERIVQVGHPDLPSEFAALRSLDSYPGNLPVQRTLFVGREHEIAELDSMLRSARVVTLTGVGGVGKTRLVLQIAAEAVTRYPDGVWFIDLGPVSEGTFVSTMISSTLALTERRQGTVAESIVAGLKVKRALIILDNCEQVVDSVASVADTIVEACPDVCILATSREALGVDGEITYEVRPFPTPSAASGIDADDNDAVRLFVDRARAVKRSFTLSADNAPAIAELCKRLDGIPLAIELAAARVPLMTPSEVLARVDERLDLLAGSRRAVLERHQTLRGAVDWSYGLLDPTEQLLFARLSVFAGGFTLDAAESVTAGDGVDSRSFLGVLGGLVAKSMVVADESDEGMRYRLLETLREYASERLVELDDPERMRARHAQYFGDVARQASAELRGPDDDAWYRRLSVDRDNVRAALTWTILLEDPRAFVDLVANLAMYWFWSGEFREPYGWHTRALERDDGMPSALKALLLGYKGIAANGLGNVDEGIELCLASIACSRDHGEPVLPSAMSMLGIAALESNRPEDAMRWCDEAYAATLELDDPWYEIDALQQVALICGLGGDLDRAWRAAEDMMTGAQRLGNHYLLAQTLFCGGVVRVLEDPDVAVQLLEEAERATQIRNANRLGQTNFFKGIAYLRLRRISEAAGAFRVAIPYMQETWSGYFVCQIIGTATALIARTSPVIATQLLSALERFRRDSGVAGAPRDLETQRRTRSKLEAAMSVAEFADAWSRGSELTVDEAALLTSDELGRIQG